MSDTTPKPGLLGCADSPEEGAVKLLAAIEKQNAESAAAFSEVMNPAPSGPEAVGGIAPTS